MKKFFSFSTIVFLLALGGCKVELGLLQQIPLVAQPNLVWNYPAHNFGQQTVGSETTHTFVLTNNGVGPALGCGSAEISDTTNFTIANSSCVGSELNAGASCNLEVDFHPQSVGNLSLDIRRTCLINSVNTTVTNTIQLEVIDIPKAKIIGGGFGDLATAEAYVNGFKVGDPVTDVSYDVGTDTFEFATEENSDFSKTTGFMSGAQAAGMFEDPHNLIKIFAGNAFAGNSNKTYELGDITVKDVSIFNNAGSNNIKIEKYSFNARGLSYDTGSTFEFGQFIGNGDQPKFVFNSGTRVIVNEDFTLMIGTHGRYTEFCDLKTTNAWGSGNSYDFKSNVIFDNSKNLVTGAATKLYNATFLF